MSGIAEARLLDTEIKNLCLFCRKVYHFIVSSCTNGGHFGFCHFSVSLVENNFRLLGFDQDRLLSPQKNLVLLSAQYRLGLS